MLRNAKPNGPDDLIVWVVKQAIVDVRRGNRHSEDALAFLNDDGWVKMLGASEATARRIRAMIRT